MEIEDYLSNQYFTKYSEVDSIQTVAVLNNQSMLYSIVGGYDLSKMGKS